MFLITEEGNSLFNISFNVLDFFFLNHPVTVAVEENALQSKLYAHRFCDPTATELFLLLNNTDIILLSGMCSFCVRHTDQ